METYMEGAALRQLFLGIRVDRATSALPQTAAMDIFTITGGRVVVTAIVGEVTTLLGVVGNLSLEVNPTVGTTTALCAVVAAGAAEVNALFSLDGVAATALTLGLGGAVGMQQKPIVVSEGTIAQRTSASDTGAIQWSLWYFPLDEGAAVVAA